MGCMEECGSELVGCTLAKMYWCLIDGEPPRYEEVVPDYRPGTAAQGGTAAANTTAVPSAPTQSIVQQQQQQQQQGQNVPSILHSSSPPAYWNQRARGGSDGVSRNTAPSAPVWEEQQPVQQYPTNPRPGMYVYNHSKQDWLICVLQHNIFKSWSWCAVTSVVSI